MRERYQLLEPLGAGGMGTVYAAYDRLTGQQVALKRVLSSPLLPASMELRLALTHEFQALASLRHPHVMAVQEYGFDQAQQPYFTMELLPSASPLTAAVAFPPNTKIDLLLQLLQALVYVHRRGIVHRDLKPGNVLLVGHRSAARNGHQVKLVDFGLAAVAGQSVPPSGTLSYMAPEVIRGHAATFASDLYAVGVLAYELLAGWRPFAHAPAMVDAILTEPPDFTYLDLDEPLIAVLQTLLAKEPENRYPDAAAAMAALCHACNRPLPPETEATRDSFLQAAPFVGREQELSRLLAAMQQAMTGVGGSWLVRGESGIGKSRLLQELRTQALVQGVFVLRGVCREDGGAYHLWLDLLRPLLFLAPPDDLEAGVLLPILPDIERLLDRSIAPAPQLEAKAAQTRLHLTIIDVLRRAAQTQPLLFLLEDLHWIDEASLQLLQSLMGQGMPTKLLLVGSYRTEERPDLPHQLPAMTLLHLARLAPPQVADLCAAILGATGRQPHLIDFVQQQSEGNTFFIVEVMRTLAEESGRLDEISAMPLPQSVFAGGIQQVVERRLQRIPLRYQSLLQCAAVAGRRLDLTLLAQLFPQADLDEWLTRCANAAVVERPDGSWQWQFSHDKLRQGLLAQLDPPLRSQLHGQIAQGLEMVYAANLAPYYGELAFHFGQARNVALQCHYLKQAGQYAEKSYAGETAATYYAQLAALSNEPATKAAALLSEASVRQFLGQLDAAEAHIQAALQLNVAGGQQALDALARFLMGRIWRSRSHWPEAIVWLQQAEESYTAVGDGDGLCDTLAEIGICYYHQGQYADAEAVLTRSLHLAFQQEDSRRVASALHNLGNVSFDQGNYELTHQRYRQCLEISREVGDRAKEASAINNLGILASYQGDTETTRRCYEEALAIRQQIGDRAGMGASLNNLGILARDGGDYARALSLYGEALRIARELGDKRAMAYPLKNMGVVMVDQGRYEEAQIYYEEALALRRQVGEKWGIVSVLNSLGDVFIARQQYEQAMRYYSESLRLNGEVGDHQLYVSNLLGVAAAVAYRSPLKDEHLRRAARLLGFAHHWMEKTGVALLPEWTDDAMRLLAFVQTHLSQPVYETEYGQGQQMPLASAIAEAVREWKSEDDTVVV